MPFSRPAGCGQWRKHRWPDTSPLEIRKPRCPITTWRSLPRRAFPRTKVGTLVQTSATFISEAGTKFNVQRSTSNDELPKSGVVALNSRTGYTNAMRVSGLLITHQLSEEAAGWFSNVRQIVDELVAFVDEDRADPAVRERLETLDARIFTTHGPVFYNFDF